MAIPLTRGPNAPTACRKCRCETRPSKGSMEENMRRPTTFFPSTLALTIAGAMMSFVLATPAAVAQSHLNVPASQHVILESAPDDGTCCTLGQCFRFVRFDTQILPDHQRQPFSIPSDKTLVITDVQWSWVGTNNQAPNQTLSLTLILGQQTAVDVAQSRAMTDASSSAGDSLILHSGFTVAPGTPICGAFFGFAGPPFLSHVILGGYLDANQ